MFMFLAASFTHLSMQFLLTKHHTARLNATERQRESDIHVMELIKKM